jgi:hypothetical protein
MRANRSLECSNFGWAYLKHGTTSVRGKKSEVGLDFAEKRINFRALLTAICPCATTTKMGPAVTSFPRSFRLMTRILAIDKKYGKEQLEEQPIGYRVAVRLLAPMRSLAQRANCLDGALSEQRHSVFRIVFSCAGHESDRQSFWLNRISASRNSSSPAASNLLKTLGAKSAIS